jgi:hypothetical protein
MDCAGTGGRVKLLYMRTLGLVLLLCGVCFGQSDPKARPTYSENGKLIELANLAPLRDCQVMALKGKVKRVKRVGDAVVFDLDDKHQRMRFQFPIDRLASAEQATYSRDFLHKGLVLRANGYQCKGPTAALETISVNRVYQPSPFVQRSPFKY